MGLLGWLIGVGLLDRCVFVSLWWLVLFFFLLGGGGWRCLVVGVAVGLLSSGLRRMRTVWTASEKKDTDRKREEKKNIERIKKILQ